jgi:Rod binding domain-containing protein
VNGLSLAGVPETTIDGALSQQPHPTNIRDAAQQFEALLLSEMLRSEREAGNGWLGSGGDSSADSAIDYAEQQLALVLARQGGLGLSDQIAAGLQSASPSER